MTTGPVEPGAYRYMFMVNGVGVIDPGNPAISESNTTVEPRVRAGRRPHGHQGRAAWRRRLRLLSSSALGRTRRMHVYTPPGYEAGTEKYPVFYLLHGAGDSDDSWTTVGRANFILDNLIAAEKAKPMIVVMPAGHTCGRRRTRCRAGGRAAAARRVRRGLRQAT